MLVLPEPSFLAPKVSPPRVERGVSWIRTRQISVFPEAEGLWCLPVPLLPTTGSGWTRQRARAFIESTPSRYLTGFRQTGLASLEAVAPLPS